VERAALSWQQRGADPHQAMSIVGFAVGWKTQETQMGATVGLNPKRIQRTTFLI